jgi:hypothetical protein
MRTIIVTASNEFYVPFLDGLLASLGQWESPLGSDIACFDVGLSPNSRAAVARRVTHLIEPGWDLEVDRDLREQQPALRAVTVRPFLPRYLPGYDIYVWIDADAWVQERFAIARLVDAAAQGALAAVPHAHDAYRTSQEVLNGRTQRMEAGFGREAVVQGQWDAYLNAGVFALHHDAPHWAHWAKAFSYGLAATDGKLCSDQEPLNHAVWSEHLTVHLLPAVCNWLCHLALPRRDPASGKFCEPTTPGHLIGILHLTGYPKLTVRETESDGPIDLAFPGLNAAAQQPASRYLPWWRLRYRKR